MKSARPTRPVALSILWILAFVAAVAYQFRATEARFPRWLAPHGQAGWPFLAIRDLSAPQLRIVLLQPNASAAGLHENDSLIEVNGRSANSTAVYGEAIAAARPGDVLRVQVRSNQGLRTVSIRLGEGWQSEVLAVEVIGALLLPILCILLGFWVTAVRPRDRLAWLLLAFLLGFTSFFNPFSEFWGPLWRDLGAIYQYALDETWGIWLLLFAIYFPQPLADGTRARTFWRWVAWLVGVPLAFRAVLMVIVSVGTLENYPAVFPVMRLVVELTPLFAVASYAASIGCMACMAQKWHSETRKDARRRLSVVLIGALISFPPLLLVNLIARLLHQNVESFSAWIYGTTYLLYFVFPLTVAYAIIVQRAMDVRLIVRQSLQYTLARRGVIALQVVLSAALFAGMTALVTAHKLNYSLTVLLMGAGVWGIFLLNGIMHRVAALVDRRFFRDTYQADQILGELVDKVRTMVEIKPLLETVSQRISEALHVQPVAVLLNGDGMYRPAYASGVDMRSDLTFPQEAGTVQHLKREQQPQRVYFDDPGGWLYASAISPDERSMLRTLHAELLLPLVVKGALTGFMSLGPKRSEAPYSGSDLRLLNSVAAQTSLALEVSRLTEEISSQAAQRERMNRELEIAREVQESLFPQRLPAMDGLDYWAECRPARVVGGDYYDFLQLGGGRLGIAIGDISGKGIGAALMMANLEACLRGQAPSARSLPALVTRVNSMVYEASSASRYATFFYAEYDARSRRMTYVNAGHNPPVVLRKCGEACEVFRWETGGAVIGMLPQAQYEEGNFALQPGDTILLFTDGVSESMNAEDEEWGEEALIDSGKGYLGLPAREVLDGLMGASLKFAAGVPQHDDMTLMVLRILA